MFNRFLVVLGSLICVSNPLMAQEPPNGVQPPATPPAIDDRSSWSGDVIHFHSDYAFATGSEAKTGCVPDGAKFMIAQEDSNTHKLSGVFDKDSLSEQSNCKDKVSPHTTYLFDKGAIEKLPHSRRGFTFGALLVPYKYQLSDKSFGSATTIGPYLGYRLGSTFGKLFSGTSATFVVSAGWVANTSVPLAKPTDTSAGNNASVERSGFSTAMGLIFSVDKGTSIQFGILVGQDRLGSSANAPYKYEGKTWVSGMIGYKFL